MRTPPPDTHYNDMLGAKHHSIGWPSRREMGESGANRGRTEHLGVRTEGKVETQVFEGQGGDLQQVFVVVRVDCLHVLMGHGHSQDVLNDKKKQKVRAMAAKTTVRRVFNIFNATKDAHI